MRALIVYESLYGNTHIIANSIAEGLRDKACDVTVVPVNRATAELVRETDLLVVGGPTHMHGMSSTSSRRMAVDAARKPGSGLTLEPVALAPGLREWLHGIGPAAQAWPPPRSTRGSRDRRCSPGVRAAASLTACSGTVTVSWSPRRAS